LLKENILMVKVTINADSYNNGMVTRKCPHCGEEKSIDDFGYRNMGNDNIRKQSWCKECR
jgi:hypothetical protein